MASVLRAIPLPLRIAAIVVLCIVAYGLLGKASSSLFSLVAMILWVLVILVWLYDQGWLKPLAQIDFVARFLGFMANRRAVTAPAPPASSSASASGSAPAEAPPPPPGKLSDTEREKLYSTGQAALAGLRGNDGVRDLIFQRIVEPAAQNPDRPFGSNVPATILLIAGPRGIGKTSAAYAIAQLLAGVGAVETATIALVRPTDLRGGEFHTSIELARAKAGAAERGVLIVDDADWLLAPDPYGGQDSPGIDFGVTLVDSFRQGAGSGVIIATLGTEALGRLKEDAGHLRWLGKLARREIVYDDLDDDAMLGILEDALAAMNWRLDDDNAKTAARRMLGDLRDRKGPAFDNAEACRRTAELLVEVALEEHPESAEQRIVTLEILRLADEELE